MSLLPCPECSRHVRATDATCPFCGHALPLSLRASTPAAPSRLGRGATFAFGVALVGATMIGCGDDDGPAPGTDSGTVMADSGGGTSDAGGARDSGGGGIDSGPAATDSGAGSTDSGPSPIDAGGMMTLYGGPPSDAGSDAGGGIAPLYGAPPPA